MELTHPVFEALDALDIIKEIDHLHSEIQGNEKIQQLKGYTLALCEKIKVFTGNRGLHVDRETFMGWRDKLSHADERVLQSNTCIKQLECDNQSLVARTEELIQQVEQLQTLANDRAYELMTCSRELTSLLDHRLKADETIQTLTTQLEQKASPAVVSPLPVLKAVYRHAESQTDNSEEDPLIQAQLVLAQEDRDMWQSRYKALESANNKPLTEKRMEEMLLLAELENMRQIIEVCPSGDAWEHVMACGPLATAVALKQRLLKSPHHKKRAPKTFPRIPIKQGPNQSPRRKSNVLK